MRRAGQDVIRTMPYWAEGKRGLCAGIIEVHPCPERSSLRVTLQLPRSHSTNPAAYDADIRHVVPGYELLHTLVGPVLASFLGASARILVVGCGTGREVVTIARTQPHWQVDAIDTSLAMAEASRNAADRAGVGSRVRVFTRALAEHPEHDYDGIVCLLVGHFVPDDGRRLTFLGDLGSRLRARGVLLLAELVDDGELRTALHQSTLGWAQSAGASSERVALLSRRLESGITPLTTDRLSGLAISVSLTVRGAFFRALGFAGHILVKERA